MGTKTRFKEEAKGNSEMAHYLIDLQKSVLLKSNGIPVSVLKSAVNSINGFLWIVL